MVFVGENLRRKTGNPGSRYLYPTFPRGSADFHPDSRGRAYIPAQREIINLPGYSQIGNEHGQVVVLADGYHATLEQPGELSRIRVFGNGTADDPLHHYAFWHGRGAELGHKSVVGFVQQCPGMLFDLSCGCGNCRTHTVKDIYGQDAAAGAIISFDAFVRPSQKLSIARSMMESIGVKTVDHVIKHSDRDPLTEDCYLRRKLLEQPRDPRIYFGPDRTPYLKTHDMVVFFEDGEPARLIVLREPPKEERNGFNRAWKTHYVLVIGDVVNRIPVVRYHSECVTADHGSNACDCEQQRVAALKYMRENGAGVLFHAEEDGMDLGRTAKLPQTFLTLGGEADLLEAREHRLDIPQDLRDYSAIDVVRQILRVSQARIASNNLNKRNKFERFGIEIVGSYPMRPDLSLLAGRALVDIKAKNGSGRYAPY